MGYIFIIYLNKETDVLKHLNDSQTEVVKQDTPASATQVCLQ